MPSAICRKTENGMTVEVTVNSSGRAEISLFGEVTQKERNAATQLKGSTFRPEWIANQIFRNS